LVVWNFNQQCNPSLIHAATFLHPVQMSQATHSKFSKPSNVGTASNRPWHWGHGGKSWDRSSIDINASLFSRIMTAISVVTLTFGLAERTEPLRATDTFAILNAS